MFNKDIDMSLFENKNVKKNFVLLTFVLLVGIVLGQIVTYINVIQFKNEMIIHDYGVSGYLLNKHPELAFEIQESFTSTKSSEHIEKGKSILGQVGYEKKIHINLLPQMKKIYKINRITNFLLLILLSTVILFIIYNFFRKHFSKIEMYQKDIHRIISGEIQIRLDDRAEGSLSKLATSINIMTTSLYTHIIKEKQSRFFLKYIITNISHQIKTPLAALTMYTEIMKDENIENEVISKFLNRSECELDRIQKLIINLLKLAKLDAGIIELNRTKCEINKIIEAVTESFEIRLMKEKKIFEVKSEFKVVYCCDREWLFEAISNIFKNAVEHTREGNHISILIEQTPLLVKIIIEDNGEGIHAEDINHIFKRFYRSRFSQEKQGTGIGLALAKTIIEMHHGFISVDSTINKGTKFTIHLPNLQNCKI